VTADLVVCVLTDVFTPPEKTLIDAGWGERVRETRAIHQVAVAETYRERMAETIDRPITAHLSSLSIDPPVAVEIFMLA
jgi:uncharacterized protein YbcI